MSSGLQKIPPQNIEAEMSLLGAILLDKEAMFKVVDKIEAEEFYANKHGKIFEAMMELHMKNEPIDVLTLSNKLTNKNILDQIGGHSYLITLSNAVPTAAHIDEYANIIRRKATHRKLLSAAEKITELGYKEEAESIEDVLDEAQQHLYGVTQTHIGSTFTSIQSVLHGAFDRIDELHRDKGKLRGIPTGYRDLDNLLAGFQKSDLIILAARPSVGKTSFCLDMARHMAVREKVPVGLFSLEMSKEQLVDRLLCAEAGVDLWKMRTGNLSDKPDSDDFPRIGNAMSVLSEAPIYIDDHPGNNVLQIRAKARRLQSEHGLGMIIIDYLQLMESHIKGKDVNRVQEVAEMSRNLKGIARELNIPVLALAQLSRAVEQTKPAVPKLSHLRDSGSIEQDADVVMFIYRKAADRNYRLEDIPPDERNLAEIHIAKHRNGPTGVVNLFFDATRASFKTLDSNYMNTAPAVAPPHPKPTAPIPTVPTF
ncbi:MAG: replicative DNA helicase [Candidatus Magasanikbacteria bacterium CG10_big_fil_rev_8_21_14_0_10_43_6]|uniref:Replicative DNA helicase n=1 Tax=Candidatus Magasanikbacteria bacterium CG10_big_fil_rev_8_21_14_0_10_43_6 TaxID=1974650 RepID=A0A2M6VZX9_9BACT|nr:MAG: replicative DNA helicase [Candidatus Magasanikbacteria bacterium CG10_big_fil_rev_8_21_14_0_10_43_6]